MIICTSYGFELVDVTTGETVVEGQTDDRSCPVCDDLAIGASSLINFDVPSIETVQLRVVATLTPAKTFQVALQSFARNRNPRAPPISA
ncbi:MAG: hypothetical protein C0606_06245 [Hyphomicrobiales bacterium]|nr:MAG: hypothetical protein C0606_06245 [Hyphomicrobiales bacterium]